MDAGKGTIIYKNNDKYEGDWANDMRHGLGTLWIFKDGKYVVRYNGDWRNDRPTVRAACGKQLPRPHAKGAHLQLVFPAPPRLLREGSHHQAGCLQGRAC